MQWNRSAMATLGAVGVALITVSGCGAGAPTSSAGPQPSTPAAVTTSVSVPAPTSTPAAPASTTPTTTPTPKPTPSTPSPAALQSQLSDINAGARVTVVAVPGGGYDAMVSSNNRNVGQVSFWHHDSTWRKVGDSTYPYENARVSRHPLTDPAQAQLLKGMSHPIFILNGSFSGDSTANAISFTDGPHGWGVIKALPNGNLASSGAGVGFGEPGLENDAYFTDGLYETAECSRTLAFAQCTGNQRVLKYWGWNGTELTLQRTAGLPR